MGTVAPDEGARVVSPNPAGKVGKADTLIVEVKVWHIREMNQGRKPPHGAFGRVLDIVEDTILLIKPTDLLPDGQIHDLAAGAEPIARAGPGGRVGLDIEVRKILLRYDR